MSARDDATTVTNAWHPASVGSRVSAAVLAGMALGAALAGVLAERFAPDCQPRYEAVVSWRGGAPGMGEWPRPARPGERAVPLVRDGREWLRVRSFTAAGVEALGRDLQRRRLSGVDAAAARRAALRAQWRAARTPGPPPPLSPPGQCAALVRGRLLLVALADRSVGAMPPLPSPDRATAWRRLERAEAEVERLALLARPDSLARALTGSARAEGAWLRALAGEPVPGPQPPLAEAWLWHERSRAPVLDRVERALESSLSKAEGAAVVAAAYDRALALERLAPDPAAVLFVWGGRVAGARAVPVARTWLEVFAVGALAGGLAGAGLGRLRPRPRRAGWLRRGGPGDAGTPWGSAWLAPRDARRAWDADLGWLHVVSGPDRGRVAHAAGILAESFQQRGDRVLLVDAGRGLRLHERFGADTRWGLGECLAGQIPLLGAVQAAGRPGFYLLARGAATLAERWDGMSRLLETSRAHFGRVILAVDSRVPRAAALPLGGRVLEAWWAEAGPDLPRGAVRLSERLGIPFNCLSLDWLTQAMHEVHDARAESSSDATPARTAASSGGEESLRGAESTPEMRRPVPHDPAVVAAAAEVTQAPAVARGGAAPAEAAVEPPAVATGPVVLGCDAAMRERLRFLIWMRRVQAEGRRSALGTGAGR